MLCDPLPPDDVPRLDRFLQAIFDHKAQGLLLAPGRPASLLFNGAPRAVTKEPLTSVQIVALVKEITPSADQAGLEGGAACTFTYAFGSHLIAVQAGPEGDGTHAVLRPASAVAENGTQAPPGAVVASEATATKAPGRRSAMFTAAADGSGGRAELEQLLRLTSDRGASDLHLRTGEQPILRLDGHLVRLEGAVLEADHLHAMITSVMRPVDLALYKETGDVDWAWEVVGVARFRCNAAQERRGPMAVFRVIPSRIMTVEELGLSPAIQKLCYLTKGLVLVTGPTGSGKSTTLAALVDLINRTRTDHILTIEDPIEFVHPPKKCIVTQREIGQHSQSFKAALRAALREDPDVILVGELRDLETVCHRHRDGRNRAPGLRDAAHHHCPVHHRPDHRPVPRRSAGAGAGDACRVAEGGHRAGAPAQDWGAGGWRRRRSCSRSPPSPT